MEPRPIALALTRVAELDAVRGLAAIAVVAYHYGLETPWFDCGLYAGLVGLDLFFVLSGFLISSIILDQGGGAGFLRSFYVRRGLRIWPAYYLLIPSAAAIGEGGSFRARPAYLTFTQNLPYYWSDHAPTLGRSAELTWSLAVEEPFYLAWPILLGLIGACRMRLMALALIFGAIAARQSGFHSWILLCHVDAFAVGGLLAATLGGRGAEGSRAVLTRRFALIGLGGFLYLAVALPLLRGRPFDEERGPWALNLTVVPAFFASLIGLVVLHAGHPALAPLRARWLTGLGTISYGIYLYHIAVLLACGEALRRLGLPTTAAPLVAAPLTVAVARASWRWVETPFLRFKDRFPYRRPSPIPTAPVRPVARMRTPAPLGPVDPPCGLG